MSSRAFSILCLAVLASGPTILAGFSVLGLDPRSGRTVVVIVIDVPFASVFRLRRVVGIDFHALALSYFEST